MTTLPPLLPTSGTSEGFCALLHDGTAACWGANEAGQLGRGDEPSNTHSATPARVSGISDVVELNHTCALDKNGSVWCWGAGAFLREDAAALTTERTPVKLPIPPAKVMATGRSSGCAAVDEGLLCWGYNGTPYDVSFAAPSIRSTPPSTIPLPPGAPIRDIVIGQAAFVVRDDGKVLSWGQTPPLGRVSSLLTDPNPDFIGLENVMSLDVNGASACSTARGTAYCWGAPNKTPAEANLQGPSASALPAAVVTSEPVVQVATTVRNVINEFEEEVLQPQRWCAIGSSGAVYCWGYNASGQAGNGTKDYAANAVKVQGLPEPAAEVRTHVNSTCALLTDGSVYCWGSNFYGQLGDGALKVPSTVPVKVVLP